MKNNPNPPSTRSTTNDDRISALEVSNHSIRRQVEAQREEFVKEFTNIKKTMEALSSAIAQMGRRIEGMDVQNNTTPHNSRHEEGSTSQNHNLEGSSPNRNSSSEGTQGGTIGGVQTRISRVDFPQFNGEDPTGWIYKAEKFSKYQKTADEEKIALASFHLQDDALQWYKWFEKTQKNVSWEEFTHALCVRFGPSDYEDFDEALAKLCQTGTVREYQAQFERIASQVQKWLEKALIGSYIGGLKDEIRSEVKLFRPTTLVHATSLARLQEEKLQRTSEPPPKTGLIPLPQPRASPNPTSNSQILPSATFKKLSWSEMQGRREKGLCYNCDEKFGPGHRCKTTPQVFLLDTLDEADAYGGKNTIPSPES